MIKRTDLGGQFAFTEIEETTFEYEDYKDIVQYYVNNFGKKVASQVFRVGKKGTILYSDTHKPEILEEYTKTLNKK